jgi:hypothetical protein
MQIKLDNEIFNCINGSVQLSIGSHATLYLTFDLIKHPSYENILIKLYEYDKTFKVISSKFESSGSKIKTLDIDYNNKRLEISIHCDVLNTTDINLRREDLINELLEKTFKDKHDIK